MLPVSFHPEVKTEIKNSFDWYQEQSLGLGYEFSQELKESINSIRSLPSSWAKVGQSHRRFVLSRFPYSIVYKIIKDKEIIVVAIMHNHRKPGYWHERG
ncbi:type II toxin-antitoxin system RelE/ParE family toxin [Glaciecola sp. 1036]|uniref:type II toxin-antitoxin system RelE/ParE family toxin n=1 Tax=Alteromonadaceae TaxID=72275 RepID=UPI003D04C66E